MGRTTAAVILLCSALLCGFARAAWQAPADNVFTEDQLKVYMDTTNDWLGINAKAMQDLSGATTSTARIAAVQDIGARRQACLDAHKISFEEYDWLAGRVSEAAAVAVWLDDVYAKSQADLDVRQKENDARMADAKQQLATYQDSAASGKRVMTADERDGAVKSATADQQTALDEAKQHGDDAKAAEDEATQHDADARAAMNQANNPPPDIGPDDRAGYIEGKKNDAQAATDSARESRSVEDDAKKAQAEALARADVAGKKIANPDLPQSDDDKTAMKADNDAAIAKAQSDVNDTLQTKQQLSIFEAQMKSSYDQMAKSAPDQNVQLMRKYAKQYKELFQRMASGGLTTQPSN